MAATPPPEFPPFRFYEKFFENDVHELPQPARDDLTSHLEKLQANPFSPDFNDAEQRDRFYAMQFSLGYVLYWKLQMKDGKVVRIDVLKIKTISEILRDS